MSSLHGYTAPPNYDATVIRAQPLPKPRLRGWFHSVAFFVSIPAGIVLVVIARSAAARTAAIIYALSLTALFGVSGAYHRGSWSPQALRWMKRLDHSMIFVLIAGSYTPISLLVLHGAWSIVILATVWAGAALGVTLKMFRVDGLHHLTGGLYMALGWLAVVAFPQIARGLSGPAIALMVAGGLLYTGGAVVLARNRPDPSPATFGYHEVWHTCIVCAATCHYVMILLVLRAAG